MERAIAVLMMLCGLIACAPASPPSPPEIAARPPPAAPRVVSTEEGIATWYGRGRAGHSTASGERFDPGALTAAHRTLPLGTMVRVTNLANGRAIEVRINDRGPQDRRRVIDLSLAAADALGFTSAGITRVRIERLAASEVLAQPQQ
jgi:rare lipoprotein A